MFLTIITTIFSVIGAITTIHWFYERYEKFMGWQKRQKETKRKDWLLSCSDYFIAHVIHLGGEFSMTHSLQVYSNEDGGYYFNPPKDFVSVSFNRGGDLTIIMPTELSKKAGFVIDSMAGIDEIFIKTQYQDICHLPQNSLKNEHFVKFVKVK